MVAEFNFMFDAPAFAFVLTKVNEGPRTFLYNIASLLTKTPIMKALVKKHPKEGIWMDEVPMPEMGHNDVLIKVQKNRDLRHRLAHLQMGRMVSQNHPNTFGHRP